MGKKNGATPVPGIKGNMEYCQNRLCPNGHQIKVQIFKGSGRCSDSCSKALGLDGKDVNRVR